MALTVTINRFCHRGKSTHERLDCYGRPLPPKIHEFQTIQTRNRQVKCPLQNSTDD